MANQSLSLLLGPALVSLVINCTLQGIAIVQALHYYQTFRKDPSFLKWLVAILMVLDTLQLVLNTHVVYHYTVSSWGIVANLNEVVWSITAIIFNQTVVAMIVQSFLVYRVWTLSRNNRFLTIVLCVLVLLAFSTGLAYGVRLGQVALNSLVPTILYLIRISVSVTAVIDVWLTVSLAVLLHRSRTGLTHTDSILNILILYTINTGLWTSIAALAELVTHLVYSSDTIYMVFYFNISKLYVNTFYATLNARGMLNNGNATPYAETAQSTTANVTNRAKLLESGSEMGSLGRSYGKSGNHDSLGGVHVITTVEHD